MDQRWLIYDATALKISGGFFSVLIGAGFLTNSLCTN